MKNVYITKTAHFLPNQPVSNDEMEKRLGMIDNQPSRARRIVLRNNGIKERYYAVDANGKVTHNNAQLTQQAVKNLCDSNFSQKDIELLSCGTTGPDNLLPSHASMVHGLLDTESIELNSASGVCCSGMSALKYGYLSVLAGSTNNAVCTGSERSSSWMQSQKYNEEIDNLKKLEENPVIGFKKDFLRWMLSDGAGAFLLEGEPSGGDISLRIDWMEAYSYAYELEACMYAGGEKMEDGSLKPWTDYTPKEWLHGSIFSLKQDVKVLDKHVVEKAIVSMKDAVTKNGLDINDVSYFLPHMSSFYFENKLDDEMINNGLKISKDRWFTNLENVGNVGAASIYLMIDELMGSGKLKKGEKILVMVPESGRFSYFHILLTVC